MASFPIANPLRYTVRHTYRQRRSDPESGVAIATRVSPLKGRRWSITWPNRSRFHAKAVEDLYHDQLGGSATFTWTPPGPGESSGNYRFAAPVRLAHKTATAVDISVVIEEVI
jgi:hypothetical protein|tara:strand:+ start:8356 stop:8694 length:339 start_codon:yes stop_codon:yes gene_type:complete